LSGQDYEAFRVRVLTERIKTGSSALKIGRRLGVSKGTVIGILWRAGKSGQLAALSEQLRPPSASADRARSARPKAVTVAHPKPRPPPEPRPPPPPPLVSAMPAAVHWHITASAIMRPPEAVCIQDAPRAVIEAATAAPAVSEPVRHAQAPEALPEPSTAVLVPASPVQRRFVPILIAPNHANADERRAEAQRANAHAVRLANAPPISKAEEQRLIERHLREKGVTSCPTMGTISFQNDFSGPAASFRRFRSGSG
jgi:hypothetical protein